MNLIIYVLKLFVVVVVDANAPIYIHNLYLRRLLSFFMHKHATARNNAKYPEKHATQTT